MELILWRHAEAEAGVPGKPDELRALTEKGRKQAEKMGSWLDRHLPEGCRILASPALRTVETAEALRRKFKTHPGLAPDLPPERILDAARWPDGENPVLVVGHQPALGQVAALLVGGVQQNWTLRKAAVCWIAQKTVGDAAEAHIKALLGPDLAGK